MNKEKLAYNLWHGQKASEESSLEMLLQPWHRTVERLIPDLNDRTVLEIGCGRGDFSIWLAKKYQNAKIIASDFSETAIAAASRKVGQSRPNLQFTLEDAESLSFL